MRSCGRRVSAVALLLFAALACGAERHPIGAFTEKEVTSAVEELRKDPNLARDRTITTLKWVQNEQDKKKQRDAGGGLKWLLALFAWITQNGRFLFWGVLALLAGLLLVYLWRLARNWSLPQRSARIEAPSFVRDLDIRPESLPVGIGAAARQLWGSGEHRSALALLYRGLLSRLVHVHMLPIRDSSTEGDCLTLANRHLKDEERKTYVADLVRLWQRAVYGGENVPTESVYALCDGFARALDQPEAPAATASVAVAGAGA